MSNDRMEKNVTIFTSFFEKNNPRGKNPRGLKEQDRLYGLPEAVRVAFDFEVFVFEEFSDTELAVEVVPFFVGLDADLMLFDVAVAIEDHAEVLVALVLVADEALFGGDVIRIALDGDFSPLLYSIHLIYIYKELFQLCNGQLRWRPPAQVYGFYSLSSLLHLFAEGIHILLS